MQTQENSMKDVIQKLTETYGPSGFEGQVRQIILDLTQPLGGITDAMGNLIIKTGEKQKNGMRIMVAAHMDEIGVMVSHIDDNGFARFSPIGGVYARNCVGSRVRFAEGTVGVIGMEKLESPDKMPALEKFFIDTGATNRKNCKIKVGDTACFERPFTQSNSRLVAKAMDDRVGCAVMLEAMKRFKESPHEIFFVFSTQEEVGLRGATTAAYLLEAEVGISVDVTVAGDTPRANHNAILLGSGPAIKVRDSGMISDPRLVKAMTRAAEKGQIPHQFEVLEGGTTDARVMQISRAGMPAGCISIPCRYVHTPSEMVDYNDVENAVKLLVAILSHPIKL
jgi:endoglucanase